MLQCKCIFNVSPCESAPILGKTKYNREMDQLYTDVTSVKYNKEKEIFSHYLTCFSRVSKKV